MSLEKPASFLIRDARILDSTRGSDSTGDCLIEEGRISAIDQPGKIPNQKAERIIDGKGKWLIPGLIDVHVHLREPGLEHKETIETGTRAAVAGGFTSVACMANTLPVNDNPYITSFIRERARATGHCRVFPIGAVSKGLKGEELAEVGGMVSEGAVAISDDGMPVMNSYLMRRAMEYARAFGIPVISHAEDSHLSHGGCMNEGRVSMKLGLRGNPAASEEIMVAREIALCRLTGAKLHLAHVSSRLSLEHLKRAKEQGLPITAEVTPHHLVLSENDIGLYNTHCKMAPPLRTEEDNHKMVEALSSGLIDMIATDHAPHGDIEKEVEFDQAAFGILGLQSALSITLQLVNQEKLTPLRWLESLTTKPAKLLGLSAGSIQAGAAADVALLDPKSKWIFSDEHVLSRSRNSPFLNREMTGKVLMTWVGGKIAYEKH